MHERDNARMQIRQQEDLAIQGAPRWARGECGETEADERERQTRAADKRDGARAHPPEGSAEQVGAGARGFNGQREL